MTPIIESILKRNVKVSYTIEELTSLALDCFTNSTHQPLKLKQNINFNFINNSEEVIIQIKSPYYVHWDVNKWQSNPFLPKIVNISSLLNKIEFKNGVRLYIHGNLDNMTLNLPKQTFFDNKYNNTYELCFEKSYPVNSSTTINGEFFVRCHENGHKWVTLSTEYPTGGFDIDKQFGWSGTGNYRMKTMYYYLSETDKEVLSKKHPKFIF